MTQIPNFRTGAQAAEEAAPKGGGGSDYGYFSIGENDEGIVVRYLTDSDEWLTVDQHYALTRSKPSDWPKGAKWPKGMSAVCRRDPALRDLYDDCYICDHMMDANEPDEPNKAKARTWALVALREEVRKNGKVVGVRDVMTEGPDDVEIPQILIVNQAWSNYFSNAQAFAGRYETMLDRDYFVDRTGKGNQTNYPHVPLDPITVDLGDDGGEIEWDLRNPDLLEFYMAGRDSLGEVILNKSSDRFYDLFFDERHEQPEIKKKDGDDESPKKARKPKITKAKQDDSDDSDDSADEPEEESAPPVPDADRLAAIRAKVTQRA